MTPKKPAPALRGGSGDPDEPLLRVRRLTKVYRTRAGAVVSALDGVDLDVGAASILGLVGDSGGGKSTLARCLALLERPSSGEIWFEGRRLSTLDARQRAALRPRIQLVFQDPAAAVNPRFTVLETIAEPLLIRGRNRSQRRERVLQLMREVGLSEDLQGRTSLELSGGQRQRAVIARALAAQPRVLILDEGLAALDLSLQAQIVNLLLDLRQRYGLTYVLISHDLRMAAHLADEIAILERGRIVERAAARSPIRTVRPPAPAASPGGPRPGAGRRKSASMWGFVARRLLHGVLLLIAVSVFTFLLAEAAPGDLFAELRLDPRVSEETIAALEVRYGLDRPLPMRYLHWLRSMVSGELGFSAAHGMPVGPLLWPRVRNTLLLTSTALVVSWLLAIPLGLWFTASTAEGWWQARRRGGSQPSAVEAVRKWGKRALLGAAAVPLAVPEVVLGLGCLWLAASTGWFPTGGMVSLDHGELGLWSRAADLAWHLTLPATALVLGSLPLLLRHVGSALAEATGATFVRAARGHGIGGRRLLVRYILLAAANPLITLFGLSVARLLSSSLLIEVVMSWPGIGPLLLDAILARDLHLVLGATLLSCAFLVAGNLLADVLLYLADPRIRADRETA